jgi:hypothetical protein
MTRSFPRISALALGVSLLFAPACQKQEGTGRLRQVRVPAAAHDSQASELSSAVLEGPQPRPRQHGPGPCLRGTRPSSGPERDPEPPTVEEGDRVKKGQPSAWMRHKVRSL